MEFCLQKENFASQKAQDFYNCSDHHKTWRFLEIIILFSATDELLDTYVNNADDPSVEGYWEWSAKFEKENDNFYYLKVTFKYLFAIITFRTSVRLNCYEGK